MILAPSAVYVGGGFVPSIILNDGPEYPLVGTFPDYEAAVIEAQSVIEAIRADLRSPAPEGYTW